MDAVSGTTQNGVGLASAGMDGVVSALEQLKATVMSQIMALKDQIMAVVLLIFAYLMYYGGIAGILIFGYLSTLLINTSLAGSALALLIQPWVGLGLTGASFLAVLLYLWFVERPEAVVGVDIQELLPKKPEPPVPESSGWFSWLPSLPF